MQFSILTIFVSGISNVKSFVLGQLILVFLFVACGQKSSTNDSPGLRKLENRKISMSETGTTLAESDVVNLVHIEYPEASIVIVPFLISPLNGSTQLDFEQRNSVLECLQATPPKVSLGVSSTNSLDTDVVTNWNKMLHRWATIDLAPDTRFLLLRIDGTSACTSIDYGFSATLVE